MKSKKRNLMLSLLSFSLLCSCNNGKESSKETTPTDDQNYPLLTERETYENKFGEDKIPGQWTDYGIGDPFVLRHNGKYYLYASTKNFEIGIRGWESEDMIHWKQMTGEGMEKGYVSMEGCTETAYASEVIYYNGYFYLCESQAGNGHYILRSEKPEGPFKAITGNFGESIDGSFFLDDDEQLYFLRASNTGIRLIKVNDDMTMGSSKTLDNTQIGSWTEGPYLLKKDGTYFLTYTGNAVTSEGYRIGYSYATGELFSRSAFQQGDTIILNTSDEFKGLGHSSTVLGPNLDSYYIAYHNLNSSGGPNRSFNLSRLTFSGTTMEAVHPELKGSYVPEMPDFKAEDKNGFKETNGALLTEKETSDIFSAEYNFQGKDAVLLFSYQDDCHYEVSFKDNSIVLSENKGGTKTVLQEEKLKKNYDFSKLHTIRITNSQDKFSLYFDTMQKMAFDKGFEKGKIGYLKNDNTVIHHTSFSHQANGSSDRNEINQETFLATNYLYASDTGVGIRKQEEKENLSFNGKANSYDVELKANSHVTYPIAVDEDGYYGIDLTYDNENLSKEIFFQIDNGTIYRSHFASEFDELSQYQKTKVVELDMTKGVHNLTIYAGKDDIAFHKGNIYRSSKTSPSFENNLKEYVMKGSTYMTTWKLKEDGHYSLSGSRNLVYFGDDTLSDYTAECDIELVGETQASTVGLLLRGKNPAFASNDDVNSIQGYYVGFNNSKFFISKCDYNNSYTDIAADAISIPSSVSHHLKVKIKGNKITVTLNDGKEEHSLEFVDSIGFTHGYFGLYTNGASCIYRNLKMS